MTIQEKLASVQAQLKAPKSQYNDFGNFNYRSCEDILEALKPILRDAKAILTISDELVNIGSRYYIKATAAFQDTESDGKISTCGYAREAESRSKMDDAQLTGSASSYARKYALNGLFCIDDSKVGATPDPDALNNQRKSNATSQRESGRDTGSSVAPVQKQERRIGREEVEKLRALADQKGVPDSAICQRYGKNSLTDLSGLDYRRALAGLNKMPDRMPDFMKIEQCEIPDDLPFR